MPKVKRVLKNSEVGQHPPVMKPTARCNCTSPSACPARSQGSGPDARRMPRLFNVDEVVDVALEVRFTQSKSSAFVAPTELRLPPCLSSNKFAWSLTRPSLLSNKNSKRSEALWCVSTSRISPCVKPLPPEHLRAPSTRNRYPYHHCGPWYPKTKGAVSSLTSLTVHSSCACNAATASDCS